MTPDGSGKPLCGVITVKLGRGLPCMRRGVQGVERRLAGERTALRLPALRRGAFRRLVQSGAPLRGGRLPGQQDDQLPHVLHALRRRRLCDGLPHGSVVQARRRNRARRPGQVHGLQPLRVGMSVWRARARSLQRNDEKMHAMRRSHQRRAPAGRGASACVRSGVSHACAFLR